MERIALQLYTVREEMAKDVEGTLRQVAEIGYKGVEFAGFFDIPAEQMKKYLEAYHLQVVGSHTPLEEILGEPHKVIAYNQIIGNDYIVCPWAKLTTRGEVKAFVGQLKEVLPLFTQAGMRVLYHNHEHELKRVETIYPLDELMDGLSDEELNLELDTFWVYYAGIDVEKYMEKNQRRIALIHLKDGKAGIPSAIGLGDAPIEKVIEVAKRLEIPWLIVENDRPTPNGIEDINVSMHNLKEKFKIGER